MHSKNNGRITLKLWLTCKSNTPSLGQVELSYGLDVLFFINCISLVSIGVIGLKETQINTKKKDRKSKKIKNLLSFITLSYSNIT